MPKIEKLMWFDVDEPMRPSNSERLVLFCLHTVGSSKARAGRIGFGYWDANRGVWRFADGDEAKIYSFSLEEGEFGISHWAIPTGNMR